MQKRKNTFDYEYTSDLEGLSKQTFRGQITARIPTLADKSKIAVRKSQILGGMYCVRDEEGEPTGRGVDAGTEFTAHCQAYLERVVEKAPDWFKFEGDNAIMDEGLVFNLYKEVYKYERTFRGSSEGAEDSANGGSAPGGEGDRQAQPAPANGGGNPTEVVGGQVLASLDA